MKIARTVIIFLIILVVIYFGGMFIISSIDDEKMDLSYINDITQGINTQYEKGIREFNAGDDYRVLLFGNDNYSALLNDAVLNDSVITDIITSDKDSENILVGKVIFNKNIRVNETVKNRLMIFAAIIYAIAVFILLIAIIYIYVSVIKPFNKLKGFAKNIAAGELDIPLYMEKENYFGAFTESFDLMRDELARARKSEYEANKSKKELVASLSHDIKTPVSTIKAICEVLEVKLPDGDCKGKIETIAVKADVIDKLVSDMLNSTLEDLNVLKIQSTENDSHLIEQAVNEINSSGRIETHSEIPDCLIWCDPLRTVQVVDNIISNAYKYSAGRVHINYELSEGFLMMRIRDEGEGVPEEDMAMICEKFYRGRNTEGRTGAGLGLYLSKVFMEAMKGYLDCYNDGGFVVELRFKLI